MYCKDFEYDGHFLSEFNSIICSFNGGGDFETKSIGSNLTYNTVRNTATNKVRLISTQYDEVLSPVFQISKFSCDNPDDTTYNEIEVAQIMRWLNQKNFKKFKPIYESAEFSNMYLMGSFNVQAIKLGYDVVGFELTLNTDAPYGYYEDVATMGTLGGDDFLMLVDISDEIGFLYPATEIKINETADNIIIYNSSDDDVVQINNVTEGEIITLDGNTKIITSSIEHDTLCNDFNYKFLKVVSGENSKINNYTSNINCEIKIKYAPICKAPVLV